ncbi:hypothetical protein H6G89_25760 [Oscillatoria sp. FACHB-1407]|uniref:hypothetical protein n=1 Tax=Oscillatoria sp. FACHB-1407 TaxID=2692847 RepID=UPI0016820A89|nr:hypothetical protein [Oscillatoria sp. FACHB-1407]MBD2464417.1 hypothetical protein [Oscillatoria sp. FACHB-1407]
MKYSQFCSIGLLAALSIGLSFSSAEETLADDPQCRGASCTDRNPVEFRCDQDAVVDEEIRKSVYRRQDSEQPQEIIIQRMYSPSCQANWTRAYIPSETYLFMRQDLSNGEQPTYGLVYVTGTGYFWADSNMSSSEVTNQACVSLSTGVWFWYDRYCTIFD